LLSLPFEYCLMRLRIVSPDVDYSTRIDELKAYTAKTLAQAKAAQKDGAPVPVNLGVPLTGSEPETAARVTSNTNG
jgi:hypothetical protein